MSIVKSFSVGNGDMFYIKHANDNFSIIDCNLKANEDLILHEILSQKRRKNITRFISTHPDGDHIGGLVELDDIMGIFNFYCVENEATKKDETDDFKRYKHLRDSDKAFYLYKNCSRKWMNISDDERGSSGINILWPVVSNSHYKLALLNAKNGGSPNNISIVMSYSPVNGSKFLWLGDLETEFMENIEKDIVLEPVDIMFAPHHGRKSGTVPKSWLDKLKPQLIIIGEAQSGHLNYYSGYNTITQNTVKNIEFKCEKDWVHIYTEKNPVNASFLRNLFRSDTGFNEEEYRGSLYIG